jgi:pyruvate formate lyase activating enzyme
MEQRLKVPLIGIVRHRLTTDGKGVTTLVAFHSCPLRCKYCLNSQCLDPERVWRLITPEELLDELLLDNLYFLATGGGVTFGGGEPLLRSEFIDEFCKIKVPEWKINIETSLNVERHHLERVLPHVDQFMVDIKDTNPEIYREYTSRDNTQALANLQWLLQHDGMAEKILVRLPHIPNHNTQEDVNRSRKLLQEMGIIHFDEFNYIIKKKQ